MSNIYLIGMMGSGKSVTGKRLASLLKVSFVDLDELIQEKTRRSINDLFEKEGEDWFRSEEIAVLKEASGTSPRVIATGGGSILRAENVERMRSTGKMVYLETSLEVLWQRVREKKDRPLLRQGDPRQCLAELFQYRKPLYERACDWQVPTDGQTADSVAQKIFNWLQNQK